MCNGPPWGGREAAGLLLVLAEDSALLKQGPPYPAGLNRELWI